jgi:hypothetical protein
MLMLRTTIIVCGILLGLLVAAILIAGSQSNVLAGLRYVIANPWGVVTLLDLGVGLLFVAVWLALVEPNPWRAAAWIAALFILGNVVTLAYLLSRTCRARRLVRPVSVHPVPASGDNQQQRHRQRPHPGHRDQTGEGLSERHPAQLGPAVVGQWPRYCAQQRRQPQPGFQPAQRNIEAWSRTPSTAPPSSMGAMCG